MTVNGCWQKLPPTLRYKVRLKEQQQNIKPPQETKWHDPILWIQEGAQEEDDEESKKR